MGNRYLKGYSFLLYFLAIFTGFFIGISFAGFTDAAKGQGLAGGAIVFWYGIMGALVLFITALVIISKSNRKTIFRANIILTIVILAFYGYYHIKYLERQKAKELEKQNQELKKPTEVSSDNDTAMLFKEISKKMAIGTNNNMGLGMFKPNFNNNKALYFYSNLTPAKSVQEHMPIDSITFFQREYGGFDIATAPPWLVPEHIKLDYDILYFKVQSISHDFIEVIVNTHNNQTAYVDKYAGKTQYWPEFFLDVHSIEFINPNSESIFIKPQENASKVNTLYSFMKPLRLRNQWMYVELQNDDFKTVGSGWIRWHTDGELLITYNILS